MTEIAIALKDLRKKLRTRENGPASEAMEKLGIKYNRNHGLAVSEIKNIAKSYKYNHELALELHLKDIRELVLMSFMVENPETVSCKQIERWLNELKDTEQAEQIAINLIAESKQCYTNIFDWTNIDNAFANRAAFVAMARIIMTKADDVNNSFIDNCIKYSVEKSDTKFINVAKAISWVLRRISRLNKEYKQTVISSINNIKDKNNTHSQIIFEEVDFEMQMDL